ncbi:hypothetical protein [Erysipelothrix anatis]|uniref:hypothetical protein n=1 Tax=Erysipelothrix anatis TaxID=2683713 RepID=UPI001358A9B9|nr:hypothetical protein [Erysipelothrix anatis]
MKKRIVLIGVLLTIGIVLINCIWPINLNTEWWFKFWGPILTSLIAFGGVGYSVLKSGKNKSDEFLEMIRRENEMIFYEENKLKLENFETNGLKMIEEISNLKDYFEQKVLDAIEVDKKTFMIRNYRKILDKIKITQHEMLRIAPAGWGAGKKITDWLSGLNNQIVNLEKWYENTIDENNAYIKSLDTNDNEISEKALEKYVEVAKAFYEELNNPIIDNTKIINELKNYCQYLDDDFKKKLIDRK